MRPAGNAATALGVRDEALHLAAEGRLRVAGLYDSRAHNALGITVHVTGPAFFAQVAYLKVLLGPDWSLHGLAITWESGAYGVHRGDPNHVLAAAKGVR